MTTLFIISTFLVIAQIVLSPRFYDRINDYDGDYMEFKEIGFLQHNCIEHIAWGSYVIGFICYIIAIGTYFTDPTKFVNPDRGTLLCTSCIIFIFLFVNTYSTGRILAFILNIALVFPIKFLVVLPILWIDDLIMGNLWSDRPISKSREYLNNSLQLFHFIIK